MPNENSKVLNYFAEWGVTLAAIATVMVLLLMGWAAERGGAEGVCGALMRLWSPLSSLCHTN